MKDTTGQPLARAIAGLALPAVLAFELQNLYHVNDAWFLGHFSKVAADAMALVMIVQIMNFGIVVAHARGTQSLVGRRFGAGRREGAAQALAQGLGLGLRVVVPLVLLEWVLAPTIFRFMGADATVVAESTTYLRTLLAFMPFFFLQPTVDFSFQALGNTATPLRLQVVAVLVNTALNAALVLDRVPFTEIPAAGMGVVGAALATGASRAVAGVAGFSIMVRRYGFRELLAPASYRLARPVTKEIMRVGVPSGSSTFLYAAVAMGVLQVIGHVDPDAYGGYGIGFRGVESISFMMVLGFAAATSVVASHSMGARMYDRARRAGHVGAALGASVMAVTTAIMAFLPDRLAGLFTDHPRTLEVATLYIGTMAACQIPQALEMIYGDAMAGAGSTLRTAAISIPGNLLRIPLAWFLAVHLELGLLGIWYAIVASALCKGLGVATLYLSRTWEGAALRSRSIVEAGP